MKLAAIGHNRMTCIFHKDRSVLVNVNNTSFYAYSAGKAFNPSLPTVVFIHGVLNDHSIWILQSRYFANHGYNVLAIDLPGHCKSTGKVPASVEEAAQTVIALLDALEIPQASLVGHSWGALIALEACASAPHRVSHLALAGVAFPMKVSPGLLDAAVNAPLKGIDMVNTFSHSTLAPPPSTLGPGTWLYGGSRALMRRVLASNAEENTFSIGFHACNNYTNGERAMGKVACPVLFLVGANDQMTPPKAAQSLIQLAPHATTVTVQAGHSLMTEAPDAVLDALLKFIKK
jgi:pimeloyl-ACP methyl ester carboxylesterase